MSENIQFLKINMKVMKTILYVLLIVIGINIIIDLILGNTDIGNKGVSYANSLSVFLIIIAIVNPVYIFKRSIHLGATRKDYYLGALLSYIFYAAVFSVLNIFWLVVENHYLIEFMEYFNILIIFEWDRYGIVEMFTYQFFAYLLLMSLLNLLFSAYRSIIGIGIYIVLVAGIPVSLSIGSLRHKVAEGLTLLLFNPSLITVVLISSIGLILFFAAGWWFTKRREV
ncbi:hypothetical protein [Bacillus solimangrovi]|uniref:Uncharacterized protein n=1 Tax=Bacillus solimangrovi TaxID=1305675 RepID=A0A1E5LE92_9BACI|nr:hypothetical protein [Bacillus solimangrovi]OEH92390.1 hypothetical protein BFG57_16245 [Bacillus solimangrovi]